MGCRQRAGAVSGGLLIPQGAEPGITAPPLAWKVSKSLISLFCSPRTHAELFPMTFGIAHHCRQAVTCHGFSFPRLLLTFLQGFHAPSSYPRSVPAKMSRLSSIGEKRWPAALACSWSWELAAGDPALAPLGDEDGLAIFVVTRKGFVFQLVLSP